MKGADDFKGMPREEFKEEIHRLGLTMPPFMDLDVDNISGEQELKSAKLGAAIWLKEFIKKSKRDMIKKMLRPRLVLISVFTTIEILISALVENRYGIVIASLYLLVMLMMIFYDVGKINGLFLSRKMDAEKLEHEAMLPQGVEE